MQASREVLEMEQMPSMVAENFMEYPDNQFSQLKAMLSRKYKLSPKWFMVSAGLEIIIDHVARAVFNPGDKFLMPVPNFAVFEEASRRAGAVPIHVPMAGPNFRWTSKTTDILVSRMRTSGAKLVWISNPINPTGQHVPLSEIARVIDAGRKYGLLVVSDEAYGEYTDTDGEIISASRFVPTNPHLMVFRTFSKLYGLPSARVGYMMTSSHDLLRAVNLFRPYFPLSWLSLYMAQLALLNESHIRRSRRDTTRRRETFMRAMSGLREFSVLDSDTNICMIRHRLLSADDLAGHLERRGILMANIGSLAGIEGEGFLRVTMRNSADNVVFTEACRDIEEDICQRRARRVEPQRYVKSMHPVRQMSGGLSSSRYDGA